MLRHNATQLTQHTQLPLSIAFADDVAGPFPANFLCFQVGAGNGSSAFSGTVANGGFGWQGSYGRFQKVGTGTLTLSSTSNKNINTSLLAPQQQHRSQQAQQSSS